MTILTKIVHLRKKLSAVNLITLINSLTSIAVSTLLVSHLGFLAYSDLVKIILFSGIISQLISLPTQEMVLSNNIKFYDIFLVDLCISCLSSTIFIGFLNVFSLQEFYIYGFAILFDNVCKSYRGESLRKKNFIIGYVNLILLSVFRVLFMLSLFFFDASLINYLYFLTIAYFLSLIIMIIAHRKIMDSNRLKFNPAAIFKSSYVRSSWLNTTSKSFMSRIDMVALLVLNNDILLGQFELIKRYSAAPSLLNSLYANKFLPIFFTRDSPYSRVTLRTIKRSYFTLFAVTVINLALLLLFSKYLNIDYIPLWLFIVGILIVFFDSLNWWTKVLVYMRRGYLNVYEFVLRGIGFSLLVYLLPEDDLLIVSIILSINFVIALYWVLIYKFYYVKYY
jgi:hypothetical protein